MASVIKCTLGLLLLNGGYTTGQESAASDSSQNESRIALAEESEPLAMDVIAADGLMKDMGEQIGLFSLAADGKQLKPEFLSGRDGQQIVRELQRSMRAGGASNISGESWRITMNSTELQATFKFGEVTGRRDAEELPKLRIRFNELTGPRRNLQITANEEREFLISLAGATEGFFFRFKQSADGSIVCWDLDENHVSVMAAENFDEFCKTYREFTESRLLPILAFTGTGVPETRFSESIRKSVMNFLIPVDDDEMEEFSRLVADLDSTSFRDREAATVEVEEKFEQWRDHIEQAINDPDFPAESRHRLRQVFESHVAEAELRLIKSGHITELADDPAYLIWLMQQTEVEKERVGLVARLMDLTGLELGASPEAWEEWAAVSDNTSPVEGNGFPVPTFEDLLGAVGPR
ncbi:MAG: hypothetical protein AAF456_07525, partial [Planctomycetota bacterium]